MERILAVATELISESGSDCMKMSEVADRTGISIGSLYQYFPDKRAIIAALADRYHEASRACIGEKLAEVATVEEFRRAFGELVDVYYELFLQKPAMRDIWSGTQSDKALLQIELLNSREDARLVAGVLGRLMPETEAAARAATAFLVMSLGEATMRLAISVQPEEARILVETYKRMALSELLADS
jgi:AcrR family transcriptional regulator